MLGNDKVRNKIKEFNNKFIKMEVEILAKKAAEEVYNQLVSAYESIKQACFGHPPPPPPASFWGQYWPYFTALIIALSLVLVLVIVFRRKVFRK